MAKWKCIRCNKTQGVTNGLCPICGPTQTLPKDKVAEKEADVAGAAAAKAAVEAAKAEG